MPFDAPPVSPVGRGVLLFDPFGVLAFELLGVPTFDPFVDPFIDPFVDPFGVPVLDPLSDILSSELIPNQESENNSCLSTVCLHSISEF